MLWTVGARVVVDAAFWDGEISTGDGVPLAGEGLVGVLTFEGVTSVVVDPSVREENA